MRKNTSLIAAVVACGLVGIAGGQTAVERFESKAKAPLTAAPLTAVPAAEAGDPTDPANKPYLGITDDGDAAAPRGAGVRNVTKGGPAELGGLKAGDVITAIDGKPVRKWDDVDAAMKGAKIGTKLLIVVRRGLLQETKTVTLGRRPAEPAATEEPAAEPLTPEPPPSTPTAPPSTAPPAELPADPLPPAAPAIGTRPSTPFRDPPAAPSLGPAADPAVTPARDPDLSLAPAPADPADPAATAPSLDPLAPAATPEPVLGTGRATLGVSVVPLNAETRARYDVRTSARQGALIDSIRPGSPADLAGLPIGGVIVSIDGKLVKSSDDLAASIAAARPGQEVELRIMKDGDDIDTKSVRLAPASATAIVPAVPRTPADGPGSNLRRFEEMAGPLATEVPLGSSIADPSRVAKLVEQVQSMQATITALEERVKLLEAKLGNAAPAVNP
jgi:membrane-associated protease RseP (regulator of RpoE activity)